MFQQRLPADRSFRLWPKLRFFFLARQREGISRQQGEDLLPNIHG